ncbi:MAG TPA: hypothetical protein VNO81_01695, partial [Candidatus Nitrosotenuis sp.]|nr:hypothetical protein [Candidatus Nitrosotenuis sp.]
EGGADTLVVKFLHQDDEVVALVRRVSRQACDDNLVRLGLQAGPCRVGIGRKGQELECLLDRDGVTTLLHVIPFRPADLASVLDKELAILGRNVVYEEALQMAEVLFMQTLRYLPV